MADLVFWSSVALVFYAYAGYPCALMMVAAVRPRLVQKRATADRPFVSFIVTAHNEERRIREKIKNTFAQDYPADALEIIVASDCSTDATDPIVREYAGRVRLVRSAERKGKEAAQQLAIAVARGDILVFSDVATAIRPDAVSRLVMNFADPTVGCVSSIDRFIDDDGRVSGEGAYVRYEMFLRRLETRVNSLVGLSGSFFAARRAVCRKWAHDRQSDFSTLLNAVQMGLRGVLDPDAAGYYRNVVDDRLESERKVRTVVRGIAVLGRNLAMLNPIRYGLFAWQLASHKVGRWLVPFAMAGALAGDVALAPHSDLYLSILVAQVLFYAAAIVGLLTRAPALRIPAFFVSSNLAILIAWVRFARGERMTSWTPSKRLDALPHFVSR
jgi:glycosyltransferase involved in cell wall biosynthesis